MASFPDSEVKVLIPYKRLEQLLKAAEECESLKSQVKLLTKQQAALRYQFVELLEKFDNFL